MDDLSRVFVDTDLCGIPYFDVGELCLAIVRLHPLRLIDEGNHLRSRRDQLSGTDLPFPYRAVSRGIDLGVSKVYLGYDKVCLPGAKISIELHFLRLQHCLRTPFGFRSEFITA